MIKQEIEEIALLWLRGQPEGNIQQNFWSPFLEAWNIALCETKQTIRQEDATHLLAAIASDLEKCPFIVSYSLIPPLIHLPGLKNLPYPNTVAELLQKSTASPSSPRIEIYAYIALRMMDTFGPAGWLHTIWKNWIAEEPALLRVLSHHTVELNYLLSPVALPAKNSNPHWERLTIHFGALGIALLIRHERHVRR